VRFASSGRQGKHTAFGEGRTFLWRYGPGSSPRSCSRRGSADARSRPCDSQSYNGLKVPFSATVGEEPEVELALV
jgi:hypothetical protein